MSLSPTIHTDFLSSSRPFSSRTTPTLSTASDAKSLSAFDNDDDEDSDGSAQHALVRHRRSSDVPQANHDLYVSSAPTNFVTGPTDVDALAFLFNTVITFSESHRDTARGWQAEIRDVYNDQGPNSLIQTATRATALALLGAGRQNKRMVRECLDTHGQTLSKLREALQDPIQSRTDATLLSVLIMSHFDFIVGAHECRPYQDAHGRILPALLRHRGSEQLKNPRSRRLFYNTQLQVVNSRLYGASHFDATDEVLLVEDNGDHPGAKLNNMLKQIIRFQNRVGAIKTRPSTLVDVQQALEYAFDLDKRLVEWSSSLRSTWQYTLLSPEEAKVKPHQYWKAIHKYSDIWICRIWNSFRTARVELLSSTWNLMIWSSAVHGTDHNDQQLRSQQVIQKMVDDISASVPYGIGDVAINEQEQFSGSARPAGFINYKAHTSSIGWYLLNPILRVTLKAPHIQEDQREWLKQMLVRCSKRGMAQAGKGDHEWFIKQRQPVFAYSMPIVTLSDTQANEYQLLTPSFPSPSAVSHHSSSDSGSSAIIEELDSPASPPPPKPAEENSNSGLKFINTTRPGQTKDEGVQKKIRRDVMLDYHRKNTRKKMAERVRQQQQSQDRQRPNGLGSSLNPG